VEQSSSGRAGSTASTSKKLRKTQLPRHSEIVDELARKICEDLDIPFVRQAMKYRAVIKESEGWWIGWLLDLPGVNAQERTKEEVLESLRIGAQEMLSTQVSFEPHATMTIVDVPEPAWTDSRSRVA
jgi:predicted RNase H-like HicB family nuclease